MTTITLMGREDPTVAQVKRAQVILMMLQGRISSDGADFNPWIHKIYLCLGEDFMWPAEWSQPAPTPVKLNPDKIPCPLNSSQRKAIKCMLDQTDCSRTTIIQGPPGTGKTTVIASYVLTAISAGRTGIWLIAQSNVAVKNIAEKLSGFGLTKWRLLVSDDFYAFWLVFYVWPTLLIVSSPLGMSIYMPLSGPISSPVVNFFRGSLNSVTPQLCFAHSACSLVIH